MSVGHVPVATEKASGIAYDTINRTELNGSQGHQTGGHRAPTYQIDDRTQRQPAGAT